MTFAMRSKVACTPLSGGNVLFRRLFTVTVLIAISSLLALNKASGHSGDDTPNLGALSDADLKTVTVRLERIGCYGTCPAYTVTIHGDGKVEYEGKNHVKEKGKRDGRVQMDTTRMLVSEFAKAKFWELPEEYSEEKCTGRVCTDMATATTELSVRGMTHRVKHYYGCGGAPKALFDLESAIDKSANTEQWTGDVSNAGPFATTCWGDK